MNSETRTTITLFAAGILAMIMVFSNNMHVGDLISLFTH